MAKSKDPEGTRPKAEPAPGRARRPYKAPALVEYGSVAKLTQGSSGTKSDGGGTSKRPCL